MIKMHYIHEWNFHLIVNSSEDYYLTLDFDTRFGAYLHISSTIL